MKTLNFLEALEANKTRKVRMLTNHGPVAWWYAPEQMIRAATRNLQTNESNLKPITLTEMQGRWEAESEKLEVLCKWERSNELFEKNSSIPCDAIFPTDTELSIFENLVGKNTKLTIEVLND